MAAVPPPPARRRPRPGSLQRPVNAKLYRGTWLLVGLPLLIAAFSVARPQPLPPPEQLSALDGAAIKAIANDLIVYRSNRYPGSAGAINAAGWFRDQLRPYGLQVRTERFSAVVPRAGRLHMQNLVAVAPGRSPQTSVLRQLIDLGFPFSPYEQAPFISRGIPAVTLTTGGDRPQSSDTDTPDRLNAARLGQVGRAAQDLLGTLDQGAEFVQGTSSYVYVGARLIRGWAIELVLMAMLLPFLAAAVDLFARCRRRRIALAPALRSYRSRLAFWAWFAALFELFALLRVWPGGAARPPELTCSAARH